MNWTEKHTELRNTLAQLYLDRADALRIVDQIGMNPATISFSDRAINTWHEIITSAATQDMLVALIEQVLGEHPKNNTLKEALDFFQKSGSLPEKKEPPPVARTTASAAEIAHQQTLLTTYRRNLSHYLKQQAALGEAYTPPGVANGILEARSNIQRIKHILRGWNVAVEDYSYDDDPVPLTPPFAPPVPAPTTTIDRVRLRQILIEYFNDEELRDLLFEMNWDYENLPGTGKSGKARELIAMAERHQRLPELIAHIKRLRPQIAW